MSRTVESTVYTFDELSDRAKERARDWWRNLESQNFDASGVLDMASNVCSMLGIDVQTHSVKLLGGGTRLEPNFYWSGFCSQGDGACFEGSYSYRKGALKALMEEFPTATDLHAIARNLQTIQRRNFYRLQASVRHSGHYYHALSTTIDVEDSVNTYRDLHGDEEAIREELRDVMHWIYSALEREYEYVMSDEQVDENIRCNEYEFDEEGRRA